MCILIYIKMFTKKQNKKTVEMLKNWEPMKDLYTCKRKKSWCISQRADQSWRSVHTWFSSSMFLFPPFEFCFLLCLLQWYEGTRLERQCHLPFISLTRIHTIVSGENVHLPTFSFANFTEGSSCSLTNCTNHQTWPPGVLPFRLEIYPGYIKYRCYSNF